MDSTRGGLVVVDKPAGMTSHDVVSRIRRLAKTRRVGHAGTLDPMATGILVIGIEKATRLLTFLVADDKEYLATIRLGQSTVTDDAQGEITSTTDASSITDKQIQTVVAQHTGVIAQRPSAVSAIKVNGQRSYARVRAGQDVELPAREVNVTDFIITGIARHEHVIDVDVKVTASSGTYIRALARDIGQTLGVGGHVTMLRRTRSGSMSVDVARTLEQLQEQFSYVPLDDAVARALTKVTVNDADAVSVLHGKRIATDLPAGTTVGVFAPDGQALSIATSKEGLLVPDVVFA